MLCSGGQSVSPSLPSRCGVRSPRADAEKAPGEHGPRASPGDDRAALERAGSCQSADGGRIDGVAPGDVRLCLALCKAMQRLITLMWRELVWTSEAHASCKVLGRSILPEPIEAVGAQLGISHRVHDVASPAAAPAPRAATRQPRRRAA